MPSPLMGCAIGSARMLPEWNAGVPACNAGSSSLNVPWLAPLAPLEVKFRIT